MNELKRGYKQTEVGVIPEDWDERNLTSFSPFVTSGSRGWADYYANQGSIFVRITNLSRESIYVDLTDLRFVKLPPSDQEGIRTQLHDGDLLISITADIGIIGFVDSRVPKPAYINQHIALVRFEPSKVESKYLAYFLAGSAAQRGFRSRTDQGAKAGMNLSAVGKIKAAFPPLPEQRAIAGVLGDVDALIGALDRLIAKKRDLKQAAMQQLLTGQTRLPGFSGKWAVEGLGGLGKWFSGGTPGMSVAEYWTGDIPWVSPKDMKVVRLHDALDHVSKAALSAGTRLLPEGAILMVVRGMILAHSFPVARAERPLAFNQDIKALVVRPGVDSNFLLWWLIANEGLVLSKTNESTHGTKRIPTETLFALEVPVPTTSEQTAIASVLSDMDSELSALQRRRNKTHHLKQGMMQELLTGRIRLS